MQLGSLLGHITYEKVQGSQMLEVIDVCYDSRKVKQGSLFVCIKGQKENGHDYILQAAQKGAVAVVVQEDRDFRDITTVYVKDTRTALAQLSAAFYEYPAKKLKMVGITGTKGKTTTAFFAEGILREAGYHPGLMGTIWIFDGKEKIDAEHTTPESLDVQRYLYQMVQNGCDCCIMEVSSQGIKMQRVDGIQFDIGVFLNIEPDHIGKGEHASFAEYLNCKRQLLQRCEVGIVNLDDTHVERMLYGHTCRVETISLRYPATVCGYGEKFYMKQSALCSTFYLQTLSDTYPLSISLPGTFNIYNALAAIAVCLHFGVSVEQMREALKKQTVPGRCENVSPSGDYVVLIDYAHNEMSLKKLLETLRKFQPKRLVVLFGCGGNRSKLRRNKMGETAGLLADFSILTSDNPRWEEPEQIIDDIEDGIRETAGDYIRIADRKEAVYYAIREAKPGDLIVLSGKGHELYQEIAGKKYPASEKSLLGEAIKRIRG